MYSSILKDGSSVLSKTDSSVRPVKEVYEKVIEVEPLVLMASSLKAKMDDLSHLSSAVTSLESRVIAMESKQAAIEKLLEDNLNMVNKVLLLLWYSLVDATTNERGNSSNDKFTR